MATLGFREQRPASRVVGCLLGGLLGGAPGIELGIAAAVPEPAPRVSTSTSCYHRVWRFEAQADGVAVANRTAFVGSDGALVALAGDTGKLRWKASIAPDGWVEPAARDALLVAAVDHVGLIRFSAKTGREIWRVRAPDIVRPPVITDDTVYWAKAGSSEGAIVATDPETGAPRWTRGVPLNPGNNYGSLYETRDSLALVTMRGEVVAVSRRDGQLLWHRVPSIGDPSWGRAVVAGDLLLEDLEGGGIAAYRVASGAELWRAPATGIRWATHLWGAPAENGLLIADREGYAQRLTAEGAQLWRARLSETEDLSHPLIRDSAILLFDADRLMAVDPGTGAIRSSCDTGYASSPTPSELRVLEDKLILVDAYGIYGFAPGPPAPPPSSPTERRKKAESIVRSYRGTADENLELGRLSGEAADALIPRLKGWCLDYRPRADGGDTKTLLAYERFDGAFEVLEATAGPAHVDRLLSLEGRLGERGEEALLRLLVRIGDDRVLPLMLRKVDGGDSGWALDFVARSSHPDAIAFQLAALADPQAPWEHRQTAYLHLAKVGGDRGIAAVLAERDRFEALQRSKRGSGLRPPKGEVEEVLAAAFDARFHFSREPFRKILVSYPPGIEPFQLWGSEGAVSPCDASHCGGDPEEGHAGGDRERERAIVSFVTPTWDFAGKKLAPDDRRSLLILWSPDHTRARVGIARYTDGLDADGTEVELVLARGRWVVVSLTEVWIS